MVNNLSVTALEASSLIASGELTSAALVSAYLEQIDKKEKTIGAWSFHDRETVIRQARMADERVADGKADGLLLNGIPVGVKDIFDTSDMPTENGTSIHAGRRPEKDAIAVQALREAGAVIMGKTVTAELAVYTPGKTVNPHDPSRTPGGSSSGSAAAVAAGMVPLAIGTQTNGSVIRPASYCGIIGFKPTMGTIPRKGILRQAPSLDQVGVFSTNVLDSALLAAALMEEDSESNPESLPRIVDPLEVASHATRAPRLGFCKTPVWPETAEGTRKACLDFIDIIGEDVAKFELPDICEHAVSCHRTIMLYEMSLNYRRFFVDHQEKISEALLGMLVEGQQISVSAYSDARDRAVEIGGCVDDILKDFDAVLTPATLSEAPIGLESTGSPLCCTIWSLCGVPALSLPVLSGAGHMPLGLQLVGSSGTDNRFLGAAEWLWRSSRSTAG